MTNRIIRQAFRGPSKQRGIIIATAVYETAVEEVVTVSGEALISATDSGGPQTAFVRVAANGRIFKFTTVGGLVQISSSTDWLIPNGAAPSDYEVRVVATPPTDDFDSKPVANGSWIDLTADRDWGITDSDNDPFVLKRTGTFTIEVRKGSSGGALDSGVYSLLANWN